MSCDMDADKVMEILRTIRDPELGVSLFDLGIVEGVDIGERGVTVFVNFNRTLPHCKSCVPIAWMVIRAILRDMEKALKDAELKYRIVESSSGAVYLEG